MRITIPGIVTGLVIYFVAQHFFGVGVTGKGKAAG